MNGLAELIQERRTLLGDGAMGTELFARGLTAGDPPEMWNLDMADEVVEIHQGYIDAGSDIILTNSFGGNALRLKLHNLEGRVAELNALAAQRARAAADSAGHQVLVAGSIGPTGELFEPIGSLNEADARTVFGEQASGLAEGGADILWIETMSSLDEVQAAVLGARAVCALPIVVTMSFDTAGRTMMGVAGEAAARKLGALGLAAIGANCGNNIADTEAAVIEIRRALPDAMVVAKANAGLPQFKGAKLTYDGTPEVMGAHVKRMVAAEVNIVGGCCGTSISHIAYMRAVLDGSIDPVEPDAPSESRPAPKRPRNRRSRRSLPEPPGA